MEEYCPEAKDMPMKADCGVPVYFPENGNTFFITEKGRGRDLVEFVDLALHSSFFSWDFSLQRYRWNSSFRRVFGSFRGQKKNTTFGYADRFDEKYDLVRTLRVGKYKYKEITNPFNQDALFTFYRYKMLAYQEWDALYNADKLNSQQRQFFEAKSPEGLYDLEQDPHEVNDLFGKS